MAFSRIPDGEKGFTEDKYSATNATVSITSNIKTKRVLFRSYPLFFS